MAGDVVWVPVLPSLREFASELKKGTAGAGQAAGADVSRAMEAELKKAEVAAQKAGQAVEKAAAAAEKAHNRTADAAGKVRVAEEGLAKARASGDSEKIAAAEEKLAAARRKVGEASTAAKSADSNLAAAKKNLSAAEKDAARTADEHGRAVRVSAGEMDSASGKAKGYAGSLGGLAAKAGAAALAFAGFKGVGSILSGGLGRLTTIEDSTASMTVILGDAGKAAELAEGIKNTVTGTPFNLDQFMTAGKNLAAFGVDAAKVPNVLRAVGEAAAASGKGAEGVDQVSDAFGKMAAKGKVQMTDLTSIMQAGVPALQILANAHGTTADEMQKMISKGAVPAAEAIDMLTTGILEGSDGAAGATNAYAGTMEALRGTFSGAAGGLKSSLNRLGASALGPFMSTMTGAMSGSADMIDALGKKVGAVSETVAGALTGIKSILLDGDFIGGFGVEEDDPIVDLLFNVREGVMKIYEAGKLLTTGDFGQGFAKAFGVEEDDPLVDKLFNLRDQMLAWGGQIGRIFTTLRDTVVELGPPLGQIAGSIGQATAALGVSVWSIMLDLLETLAPLLQTMLVPAVQLLADLMADHQPIVTLLVGAYTAYRIATMATAAAQTGMNIATGISSGLFRGQTVAVGSSTAATKANTLAVRINAAGTKAWGIITASSSIIAQGAAGAFRLLSAAIKANPMMAIVSAITLVVGALTWFFTQTELGKKIWETVWGGIKAGLAAAWDFMSPVFEFLGAAMSAIGAAAMWLYENAIKPVFAGVMTVVGAAWAYVSFIFSLWKFAFELAGAVAMLLWDKAIQPVFSKIGAFISATWNGVISPVFGFFTAVMSAVGDAAVWLWENAIMPAWNGISGAISAAWDGTISAVFGFFSAAMTKAGELATWLYDNAIKPAWDGIKSAISTVWDFVSPILGKIGTAFSTLGDVAKNVGSAIRNAFDGVVGVLKKPVNMIGGLLARIPDKILGVSIPGAGAIKSWGQSLQALRDGGVIAGRTEDGQLYGPGTSTSDSLVGVNAAGAPIVRVAAGEGIVKGKAMDNGGNRVVAALNRGWVPSADYLAGLPGLKDGGEIGREPYGLPLGTSGAVNVPWVDDLEAEYGLDARTYAGHQERDGQNKGIDWFGPVDQMQSFAEFLLGIGDQLEQVIWSNPNTGAKVGIADGVPVGPGTDQPGYYRNDWSDHQDHVHTRQSYSFGGAQAQVEAPVVAGTPYDDTPGNYGTVSTGGASGASASSTSASSDPTTVEGIAGKIAHDFAAETTGDFLAIFGLDGITLPSAQAQEDQQSATSADTSALAQPEPGQTLAAPAVAPQLEVAEVDPAESLSGSDLYAYRIAEQAKAMGLPREAADIGGATALVEAGNPLKMWANAKVPASLNHPHDAVGSNGTSVGLFQQQDFAEWGTVAERMDPAESARMFFEHFPANWQSMDPGAVAQAVQRSSLPGRYSEEMAAGRSLIGATGVYDDGGMLLPDQLAYNASALREPYAVFNDDQWGTLDDLAERRDTGNPVAVEIIDRQFNEIVSALGGPPSSSSAEKDLAPSGGTVQITIEINGAQSPEATGRAVAEALEARMSSHSGGREW